VTHRDEITHWVVNDGRFRVGSVDLSEDGVFIARTIEGKVVGRFKDLAAAAAAFNMDLAKEGNRS
jgi:hypothetical protein